MPRLLLLFFCAGVLHAAETLWLNEEFDNTERNWSFWDNADNSSYVADGIWTLHAKKYTFFTSTTLHFDPVKDFVIETAVRYNYGADDNSIGLFFGGVDGNKFNMLSFSGNRHYKIASHDSGKWIIQKDWVYDDKIVKGAGEWNILRVEKKSGLYTFFINGVNVLETPDVTIYGIRLGTINYALCNYSIDYIRVWQDNVINVVPDPLKGVTKENLGPNVNSVYSEILPVIAPDGKTLYFSRRYSPDNAGGTSDADEIYFAEAGSAGAWNKSLNIGKPLNNTQPNWVISVTPDNQTMMVSNGYKADGSPDGAGISVTKRKDNGWEVPQKAEIKNFENTTGWYQFYLTQDRKTLLMSAGPKTQKCYGGNDLYVSFLQNDGKWSEPANLGDALNTSQGESTPFLASDGVTLYFASDGHPGYGEADIFVTKRLDDTWLKWSAPQNLGPGINTVRSDAGLTIPASGNWAIMVSNYQSLGYEDLIKVTLPGSARSEAVALVYGKVYDSKTSLPLSSDIKYNDLTDNKELGLARSEAANGDYKIVLPTGRKYSFLAAKEGFYSISENFDLTGLSEYVEIRKDLYLTPIEAGAKVRLNNLFFDTGKWDLRGESSAELARLVEVLQANPAMKIRIEGHTDDIGKDDANLALSNNRASAVAAYITGKGVSADRISAKGYGEKQPSRANDTEENRQYNRRVEFVIISK